MSRAVVGKWGNNLAIRVPLEIARDSGLSEGEKVDIETMDGDIVIRRPAARALKRAEAETAARAIMDESRRHSLGGVSIRELIEDGRRG